MSDAFMKASASTVKCVIWYLNATRLFISFPSPGLICSCDESLDVFCPWPLTSEALCKTTDRKHLIQGDAVSGGATEWLQVKHTHTHTHIYTNVQQRAGTLQYMLYHFTLLQKSVHILDVWKLFIFSSCHIITLQDSKISHLRLHHQMMWWTR